MQFVIQTVPQPHVISDWIKSSIPLYTCKIVCQEFLKANAGRCHTRDSFTPSGEARLRRGRVLCIFLSAVPRNAIFLWPVRSWQWGNRNGICTHWTGPVLSSHLQPAHGYTRTYTSATALVCQQQLWLLLQAQTTLTVLSNVWRLQKEKKNPPALGWTLYLFE